MFGMVVLASLIVFWALTGRIEPLLIATSGSLITGANLLEAYLKIKNPPKSEMPPAPAPLPEEKT